MDDQFNSDNLWPGQAEWQDDFVGPPKPVQEAYVIFLHRDGTSECYTGAELDVRVFEYSPTLICMDDFYLPAEVRDVRQEQSWPRPPVAPVSRGRLAPRQSFRKIMRSVNRNR